MDKIKPVVTIVNSAFQSSKGRFFAGITPKLIFGDGISAWGRLCNPYCSKVNLFVSLFAITNLSDSPLTADIYRNTIPPGKKFTSLDVGNGNFGSRNLPKGVIQYNPSVIGNPSEGTRISSRRVPGNITITSCVGGNAIIVPGTSFLFFLTSEELVKAEIAFDWWECKEIF